MWTWSNSIWLCILGMGLYACHSFSDITINESETEVIISDDDPAYVEVRDQENTRVENLLNVYAINNKSGEEPYEMLNIAFMTDSHMDLGSVPMENLRNIRDAIDFCNNSSVPVQAIIHGGDFVTDIMPTKAEHFERLSVFFKLGWKSSMPLLITKGNHDLNSIKVPTNQVMDDSDWGKVWYDRAEKQYGIVRNLQSNKQKSGYYYYDLNDWKVRIISVDCNDVDYSKTDSNGNVLYWGGSSYYIANEQFNWIAHHALNFDDKAEKDWGVIVFTHFYCPTSRGTTVEPEFECAFKRFNSMLLAFNNQQSYTEDYTFLQNSFFDIKVDEDWTRYSGGNQKPYVICVLSGHQHEDVAINWDGILHIVTANQFCGKDFSDKRIEREAGTRSQNLFDILNIDLREHRLRVIRYGASANIDGQMGNRFLPEGRRF